MLWHPGLKFLIQNGVDVNVEICYGRRPVHLAVALGLVNVVEFPIDANCALFNPSHIPSLLQFALKLRGPQRQETLNLFVTALIHRHSRILNIAKKLLPNSSFSKLNIIEGQKKERRAPWIYEILTSHGVEVPKA